MPISLKAKLYGESYKIHRLHFDRKYIDSFQKVAKNFGEPIEDALLNINFFYKLNIGEYRSIQDLIHSTYTGLINSNNSQIEIWLGRKRIIKLNLDALFFKQTLFPLYQTTYDIVNTKLRSGYYLEEKEIGTIGIYEIKIDQFSIDDLKFHLSEIAFTGVKYQLLNEITYEISGLNLLKSETLLRYQRCFYT